MLAIQKYKVDVVGSSTIGGVWNADDYAGNSHHWPMRCLNPERVVHDESYNGGLYGCGTLISHSHC